MQAHSRAYHGSRLVSWAGLVAFSIALAAIPDGPASAEPTLTVLHSFEVGSGIKPRAGLIADSAGTLYGTTQFNGGGSGYGTVFKLAPDGTGYTVLHIFGSSTPDGAGAAAGLIADSAGTLYGTTRGGGSEGGGTVFKVASDGTSFKVLHSFAPVPGGLRSDADLVSDAAGNLYGTTLEGGMAPLICGRFGCVSAGGCGLYGCGTVFRLAPDGTSYDVLHEFSGGSEGKYPRGGLIFDAAGNLYGTTLEGGTSYRGTVFKLALDGPGYKVLYAFKGGTDGAYPYAGLLADSAGNLYGTTNSGGGSGCGGSGCGTVFKLAPDGTGYTVLHIFGRSAPDGARPAAGLIADNAGNLYGATEDGGGSGCGGTGCGTIFKLSGTGFVTLAALKVTPAIGIVATAAKGGAIFSASSFGYQLDATSGSIHVELSGIPAWLGASFTSASVTAGSPLTETFTLGNLASLPGGTYNATIAFTNTTNNEGNTTRSATLRIYEWRDCLKDGWRSMPTPPGPFENQGRCVATFGHLLRSR